MPAQFLRATALISLFVASPALAEITIDDAYGCVASPLAKAGAVFLVLHNDADTGDRLIAASSDAAARVELHTHADQGGGVMKMMEIEGGIPIPAGGSHALKRGGDHVMFMGLSDPWTDGDMIPLTLEFEQAGSIAIEVMVDLNRKPEAAMDHGGHNMGDSDTSESN